MLTAGKEKELLCRLAKGDRNSFNELYREYFQPVYCNALKLTRNKALAEDILQEVFISLWEKKETIDAGQSLGGWLFVASYNRSINVLRKKLRESLAYKEWQEPATDQLTENNWQLQRDILEKAMNQLSPQKRKVFELCKLEGKTYEETACTLDISKHTVKEYLSAAVTFIKEYVHQPESSVAVMLAVFIHIFQVF